MNISIHILAMNNNQKPESQNWESERAKERKWKKNMKLAIVLCYNVVQDIELKWN